MHFVEFLNEIIIDISVHKEKQRNQNKEHRRQQIKFLDFQLQRAGWLALGLSVIIAGGEGGGWWDGGSSGGVILATIQHFHNVCWQPITYNNIQKVGREICEASVKLK